MQGCYPLTAPRSDVYVFPVPHSRTGQRVDGVVDRIRTWILAHELPPGTRLNQSLLATRLGVSRIPVRDALRLLAGEGLVELPTRGAPTVAGLSVTDLQELYELREVVEPLACRIAVPNVGRAQLLTMSECLDTMDRIENSDRWLSAHARFHYQLYGQSGRPRMVLLVENLRQQAERYLRLHLEQPQSRHLRVEHRDILAAADAGDAARVEERTRNHLQTSHESILGHLLEGEFRAAPKPVPAHRGAAS